MLVFYFRMSLKPVMWPDGFGALTEDGRPFSREEWIRYFFSQERAFQHRQQDFVFLPITDDHAVYPAHLIVGWIARPRLSPERTPPSDGFVPTLHSGWHGALFVVDPTEHQDGQKIAIEKRADIGKPYPILKSLAKAMRVGDDPPPFDVQIDPISEPATFWRFAEKHDFQIASITFDMAPPNMFRGTEEYKRDLRELRDRNNVNRVQTTLTSDTIVDVQQENLRQIVDYTELGTGGITAYTTTRARYSSKDHIKHDRIPVEQGSEDFWTKLQAWFGERF